MARPPARTALATPAQMDDLHDRPWFGLVYLFFVYLPLFFLPTVSAATVAASLLATAAFVPLYLLSFRRELAARRRLRIGLMLATATIGYALIPFNPGGNTFVIYAMVMAAAVLDGRRTALVSVVLLAGLGLALWSAVGDWYYASGALAVAAIIGGMAAAGTLYGRERGRRQAELMLTQDEVRRLAGMAERERIGRDLHDLLGHTLSVVALKSELAGKLVHRDPAAALAEIREVEQVARSALAQVREAVAGIRATGLQAELAAARLALLSADVTLDQALPALALPASVETALSMVLREAVTNVIRHAGARRVEVELVEGDDAWCLTVSDDGRGGIGRHGVGITGMGERVASIGGAVEVESPPGAGTRLRFRVPRENWAGPDAAAASASAATPDRAGAGGGAVAEASECSR